MVRSLFYRNWSNLIGWGLCGLLAVGLIAFSFVAIQKQTLPKPAAMAAPANSTLETTAAELLGGGSVVSGDVSNPLLRNAGQVLLTVQISSPNRVSAVKEWEVIAPLGMLFARGDAVDLWRIRYQPNSHHPPISTYIITPRPSIAK